MRLAYGLLITMLSTFSFSTVMAEPMPIAETCGQWQQVRQQSTEEATMYWLEGFVAAYNEYEYRGKHPKGVFKTSDPKVISKWLDDYCQNNPDSSPKEAVESLIEEKKPPQKACPVKKSSGRPCIPSQEEEEVETTGEAKKNKWLPWN